MFLQYNTIQYNTIHFLFLFRINDGNDDGDVATRPISSKTNTKTHAHAHATTPKQ